MANKTTDACVYLKSADYEMDYSDLETLANAIARFQENVLENYNPTGTSPLAKEHLMRSMSELELASRSLSMAVLHQHKDD